MPSAPADVKEPPHGRLLRLTVRLPGMAAHLWELGRALRPLFGVSVAQWSDSKGSLAFNALGTGWSCSLPAHGRFAAAQQAVTHLQQHSITLAEPPAVEGPMVVCALAFENRPCGRPGPFAALGGGLVVLPSCVLYAAAGKGRDRASEMAWATLQLLGSQNDASDAGMGTRLLQQWADAVKRAARTLEPPSMPLSLPPPDSMQMHASATQQQTFEASVRQAVTCLGDDLRKVVLARTVAVRQTLDVQATAQALRDRGLGATSFCLALPGGAHFLGATPETLLRLRAGRVDTEALAGTLASEGQDDAQRAAQLLQSDKNRREHQAVVSGIASALKPHLVKVKMDPCPRPLRLQHLWHLRTAIWGRARPGAQLLMLAQALHPTPALGGLPAAHASQYLLRHESWRRGLYAAPLGWVALSGDGVFVVGIRSLYSEDNNTVLFAGAGIVAGSDPHAEWQETQLKLGMAAQCLHFLPARDVAERHR